MDTSGPQAPPKSAASVPRRGRPSRRVPERTFSHRGGVRITGTYITCDAAGSATDMVFLSHAQALGLPSGGRFPLRRGARQQLLATNATLALLGRAGETLRPHALPAAFGRPFALGDLRLELLSSGHLPGAASLLCETGVRRILYCGTVRVGDPGFGAVASQVRRADAVCLDATFAHPRFVFPPRDEALGQLRSFVRSALAAGRNPVLLAPPFGAALDAAAALASDGIILRGHRAIVGASAAFRGAGIETPLVTRFQGKLGRNEALLWPPEARQAPMLGALAAPAFAFVSGFSLDPDTFARVQAEVAIGLSNQSGYADLIAYVDSTGAREVALHRGFCEEMAADLRRRGYEAYALGPPSQMDLFRG